MPSACEAMPMRPPSRVCIAILKPPPSSPRRFSSGTSHSSKLMVQECDPLMPSFLSSDSMMYPFELRGTTKQLVPREPLVGSVATKTMMARSEERRVGEECHYG